MPLKVFTSKYLNANNKLHEAPLSVQFTVLTISNLKQTYKKSFYHLVTIPLGDISLNPGPVYKHHILNTMV